MRSARIQGSASWANTVRYRQLINSILRVARRASDAIVLPFPMWLHCTAFGASLPFTNVISLCWGFR